MSQILDDGRIELTESARGLRLVITREQFEQGIQYPAPMIPDFYFAEFKDARGRVWSLGCFAIDNVRAALAEFDARKQAPVVPDILIPARPPVSKHLQ